MKLLKFIDRVEDSLLVAILSAMIILAVTQIVFRNFAGEGIVWIDPMLRVLVLWVAMSGAVVASRTDNHIRIDIFTRYIPARFAGHIQRLAYMVTVIVCLLIAWYAWQFVVSEYNYPTLAFGNVPTWLTALIIPVSFFLIAMRYLLLFLFPVNTGHQLIHT